MTKISYVWPTCYVTVRNKWPWLSGIFLQNTIIVLHNSSVIVFRQVSTMAECVHLSETRFKQTEFVCFRRCAKKNQ